MVVPNPLDEDDEDDEDDELPVPTHPCQSASRSVSHCRCSGRHTCMPMVCMPMEVHLPPLSRRRSPMRATIGGSSMDVTTPSSRRPRGAR